MDGDGVDAPPRPPAFWFSHGAFLQPELLAAAAALVQVPARLDAQNLTVRSDDDAALVRDTLNGLVAFIVPGPDAYSLVQGVATWEPGGIAAQITDSLIAALDQIQLPPPPFTTFSQLVATILNSAAQQVGALPNLIGFPSPFARLLFLQKVAVFAALEAQPELAPLAGALPSLVAFLCYSEAGVFDPQTRTLKDRPVGWTISSYSGVADGRDEFRGYFQNRRRVRARRYDGATAAEGDNHA